MLIKNVYKHKKHMNDLFGSFIDVLFPNCIDITTSIEMIWQYPYILEIIVASRIERFISGTVLDTLIVPC